MPGAEKEVSFQGVNGSLMKSPCNFVRRGQAGKWITEGLPDLGAFADQMAFVHSMTSRSNTHGPACVAMNTGFVFEGVPRNCIRRPQSRRPGPRRQSAVLL